MSVTILPTCIEIAVLALDAVVPLDLAIPAQVFGTYEETPYRVTVCAASADRAHHGGLHDHRPGRPGGARGRRHRDRARASSTTCAVAAGRRCSRRCAATRARGWSRSARARSRWPRRACSTAAARPRTGATPPTSPRAIPRVRVEPDVLYVDEGDVLTSAGVASGLDLCLHILRRDHGAALAGRIARRIVVPPHRDGGQAQYVEQPLPVHPGGSLAATRAWALERLARAADGPRPRRPRPRLRAHVRPPLRAPRPACRSCAGCSPSASTRPAPRWSPTTRRSTRSPTACGFGTAANLRKHFHRQLGDDPDRLPPDVQPRMSGRMNHRAHEQQRRRRRARATRPSRRRGSP